MQIQQIIKRKGEVLDDYESNVSNIGREKDTNSFNSGIFVILKIIVNLELQVTFIKQPVFAGP